jgi:hypothetical protein
MGTQSLLNMYARMANAAMDHLRPALVEVP